LADVVLLFFVGLYLAASPRTYTEAALKILPHPRRARVREVLSAVGATLRRWIGARLILMATNAIVTALGLWLLGMRLPITLGLLSGLLNFVPNLGPIIAAVPAVLLAFVEGPRMALYVALFYFGYQMFDGYVLTPLVQRRTVALPPALTIMSQVLMGVLFGTIGVLVAVPLTAAVVLAVNMLYLHDVLGEPAEPASPQADASRPFLSRESKPEFQIEQRG
jgi:predicted PurR-regulated permease PerM